MVDAPERIRVAQDSEGFWTCREAVSGSQEYIRADIHEALRADLVTERDALIAELAEALKPFAAIADELNPSLDDDYRNTMAWASPRVGDLRRARDLVAKVEGK